MALGVEGAVDDVLVSAGGGRWRVISWIWVRFNMPSSVDGTPRNAHTGMSVSDDVAKGYLIHRYSVGGRA